MGEAGFRHQVFANASNITSDRRTKLKWLRASFRYENCQRAISNQFPSLFQEENEPVRRIRREAQFLASAGELSRLSIRPLVQADLRPSN